MKRFLSLIAIGAAVFTVASESAHAGHAARATRVAHYYASARPWHGNYAYTPWGEPVALVVPPHADTMAAWSWGVAQSEIRPLHHQYLRAQPPGTVFGGASPWLPTPIYPSHTDQFGVYPVRGPWR